MTTPLLTEEDGGFEPPWDFHPYQTNYANNELNNYSTKLSEKNYEKSC